ncbi:hypothetical protein CNMCM5793_000747 [Aspergillus hiratsukae]|uniref:FAD-binding FR-type domain-containing protein n=1 Tax=Aspergillus hiratsukae TaxID=1194566 RepID=A0A8H6Q4G7_9EURO|nr:hypothetical protein CNMCM5793_000747 [Aspergillus hiratsukae]KAF7166118.1 hypothetical protein CNMCM6106_002076 [Aspergillus hiratsukae]
MVAIPRALGSDRPTASEMDDDGYSRGLNGVDISRDVLLSRILLGVLILVVVFVLSIRLAQFVHSYLRQAIAVAAPEASEAQRFWRHGRWPFWAAVNKHLLYAPLLGRRHNRPLRLGPRLHFGAIPSRIHTILILLYTAVQVFACAYLDYATLDRSALFAELRGRAGTLAVLNLVPLIILGCRNNPLIALLAVSFRTFNLLHRWLGRLVVLATVVHVAAWAVNAVEEDGLTAMLERIKSASFFQWGCCAAVCFLFILVQSLPPIRHLCYETFRHLHQLAGLTALLGVFFHLKVDDLPQLSWVTTAAVLWFLERCARLLRLVYLNYTRSAGCTVARVEALPSNVCRVTFYLPKHASIDPGCYAHAYFPSVSWWMSHPFSIAWTEPEIPCAGAIDESHHTDSAPTTAVEKINGAGNTRLTIIIVARGGMTRRLYKKAVSQHGHCTSIRAFVEGPYASGTPGMGSYGTVVLFSAGVGITHHLMYARQLIQRASEGLVATRRLHFTWSVGSLNQLLWVQGFLDAILGIPGARGILKIQLFVSGQEESDHPINSCDCIEVRFGRCDPKSVLDSVLQHQVGAAVVSVCGPGGYTDDVRNAVRSRLGGPAILDFLEEAFIG